MAYSSRLNSDVHARFSDSNKFKSRRAERKIKASKPEEEQILKDRKESYNRSKSDLEKIEKALESIKNEKGHEIITFRYFETKEDGSTRTWAEVAEEIGRLKDYPDDIAESTIRKYKNRLVRKMAVVIFGSDAGK